MKKKRSEEDENIVCQIPSRHQRPLPWEHPKSKKEDPEARKRVKRIMAHKNYLRPDMDIEFVQRDEMLPIRLGVDYLKPEILMKENGVKHTIVVFGSTRIVEKSEAKRKVDSLKKKRSKSEDKSIKTELKIAKKILAKSRYYDIAREFGRIVGKSGKGPEDSRVTLMTGGGPGIMEAANRGAYDVGAKSIGLNITLPHEQFPNPYISPELCFQFHYFALRKMHFLRRAKALVIFPGGFGTFDESFEILTLVQTRKVKPLPIVFVGKRYWEHIVNFDGLIEEGVIDPEDRELFYFAEDAQEAWDLILKWHIENGKAPLK